MSEQPHIHQNKIEVSKFYFGEAKGSSEEELEELDED